MKPALLTPPGVTVALWVAMVMHTAESILLDLTYNYNNVTASPLSRDIDWPYTMTPTHKGKWRGHGDIWFEMNNFQMTEHAGTHLDAPRHFSWNGYSIDQIPLSKLVRKPVVLVNITVRAKMDANTQLSVDDLTQWEAANGRIPKDAVVLVNSGWGTYWGTDLFFNISRHPNGTVEKLNFPSIAMAAAKWLVDNRAIAGVGIDTTSVESEPGGTYPTHRVLQGANLYNIENGANFHSLPAQGAFITTLPLRLEGGSGSPARIFAEWDEGWTHGGAGVASWSVTLWAFVIGLLVWARLSVF